MSSGSLTPASRNTQSRGRSAKHWLPARIKAPLLVTHYNKQRPHESLGNLAPRQ